jgi:uncharacterized protein (DUF169 family)
MFYDTMTPFRYMRIFAVIREIMGYPCKFNTVRVFPVCSGKDVIFQVKGKGTVVTGAFPGRRIAGIKQDEPN